jgi:magnesium transporter
MQESANDTFQAIKGTLNSDRINWLQIHGMKDTETIREICSHFEIDFLVLQDILNADHPTKIEEHDKYIVLILKIFYPNEHKEENETGRDAPTASLCIQGNNTY